MPDQLPTLGALSSIFQLATGVALAMSVFRAPYEQRYRSLGAILEREQRLLGAREDDAAAAKSDAIAKAKANWLAAGEEIEPRIKRRETFIWVGVLLSITLLGLAAVFPNAGLTRLQALGLIALAIAPVAVGWILISALVGGKLKVLGKEIRAL